MTKSLAFTHSFARINALDPYLKLAKWIGRSQDPFVNFYTIFYTGLLLDGADNDEETEDSM
jgi:hypothetical protein